MTITIFSENLKKYRIAKGMTQEETALALHLNSHTISRWECGTTLPDVLTLPELAKLYDVTVDDFFKKQEGIMPTPADVDIAFELLNSLYLQKEKRVIISSERTVQEITEQIDQGLGSRIFQKCGAYQLSIAKDTGKNYRLYNT